MKTDNQQSSIIAEIKRVEKSLKTEVRKTERVLRAEMLRVEERVENLEDGQKGLEDGQKEITTKLEKMDNTLISFVGRVDTLETENEIGSDQIGRLEKRVTSLEPPA